MENQKKIKDKLYDLKRKIDSHNTKYGILNGATNIFGPGVVLYYAGALPIIAAYAGANLALSAYDKLKINPIKSELQIFADEYKNIMMEVDVLFDKVTDLAEEMSEHTYKKPEYYTSEILKNLIKSVFITFFAPGDLPDIKSGLSGEHTTPQLEKISKVFSYLKSNQDYIVKGSGAFLMLLYAGYRVSDSIKRINKGNNVSQEVDKMIKLLTKNAQILEKFKLDNLPIY